MTKIRAGSHIRRFRETPETLRESLRRIHLDTATGYLRSGCFARDAINYEAPFGATKLEALSSVGSAAHGMGSIRYVQNQRRHPA